MRDADARLHWPPREGDEELDAEAARKARLAAEAALQRSWRRRRGAPDAKRVFDAELEEHLTNLVMMMTLDATAVGHLK